MVVQSEPVSDKAEQIVLRECSADYASGTKAAFTPDEEKASLCTTANRVLEESSIQMHHPQASSNQEYSVNHLLSAGRQVANHLALQNPSCTNNAMDFAYSQSAAIGVFAGAELHQHGLTANALIHFLEYAQKQALSQTTMIQLCGTHGRGADYSLGIVAASSKNLPFVHEAVRTWANGECVSNADAGNDWMPVTIRVPGPVESNPGNGTVATSRLSNSTTAAHLARHIGARAPHSPRAPLSPRTDCRTTAVQAGDGCYSVAQRCGITQANLEKYNRANLCSTLIPEEKICCSTGTLPSTLPPGNSDGTCKLRTVVLGDDCPSLAL